MKNFLIALHSAFDGDGKSIRMVEVQAEDADAALVKLFTSEGWVVESVADLDACCDISWSEPRELP